MTAKTIYSNGDTEIVEIEQGTVSEERGFAIVHLLLAAIAIFISSPDFRLARHLVEPGDFTWFILRGGFSLVFVATGIFVFLRYWIGPKPLRFVFRRDELTIDSGRPGMLYLVRRLDGEDIYALECLIRRRQTWAFQRRDLQRFDYAVKPMGTELNFSTQTGDCQIPAVTSDAIGFQIGAAIKAWYQADRDQAPQLVIKSFTQIPPIGKDHAAL